MTVDSDGLLRVSLEALSRYKLRTLLGITGIVIGVAAVSAMLSVAEGARREVIRQVELLGLNNLVFRPAASAPGNARTPALTFDDADRLRILAPFAARWSPVIERFATLSGPRASLGATVLGVTPEFEDVMALTPGMGRFLAPLDLDRDQRVCVLGRALSTALYGEANPVGRAVLIANSPYVVVGVIADRDRPGASSNALQSRDLGACAFVPARRGTFLGQNSDLTELWMQAPGGTSIDEAGGVTGHALATLHGGKRDFDLLIPRALLRQRLSAQRTFNVVLASVAVLSLLVGGIGIMNMMLASVLERTKEIGLRRTVGATRGSVTAQFLLESTLMTLAGGVLGVVAGGCASIGITRYAGWPTHLSAWAVGASLCVSAAVGLFFGTYPAWRAAHLEPADAIRYE